MPELYRLVESDIARYYQPDPQAEADAAVGCRLRLYWSQHYASADEIRERATVATWDELLAFVMAVANAMDDRGGIL